MGGQWVATCRSLVSGGWWVCCYSASLCEKEKNILTLGVTHCVSSTLSEYTVGGEDCGKERDG